MGRLPHRRCLARQVQQAPIAPMNKRESGCRHAFPDAGPTAEWLAERADHGRYRLASRLSATGNASRWIVLDIDTGDVVRTFRQRGPAMAAADKLNADDG